MLRVQPDAAPDEAAEVDAVAVAGEAQLDAVVARCRRCGRAAEVAERVEDLDGALLEDAGADRASRSRSRVRWIDDDRFDAEPREQVRQQKAGGAGADDGDAGADGGGHGVSFDGMRSPLSRCRRRSSVRDQLPGSIGDRRVRSASNAGQHVRLTRGSPSARSISALARVQLDQRRLDRIVAAQHDRQGGGDHAGLVAHRHGDARRDATR